MAIQNNMPFSTYDQDNDVWDKNCVVEFKGAWWHNKCHHSNLNGKYLRGNHASFADGVNWHHWKGYHYSCTQVHRDEGQSCRLMYKQLQVVCNKGGNGTRATALVT